MFPPGLKYRLDREELMDDPQTDCNALYATLDQFVLINRLLSRSRTLLARYIVSDMIKRGLKSCSLVDIGAGGCDLSVWLIRYCAQRGISLSVTCVDHDPRVTEYARKKYGRTPGLNIIQTDARKLAGDSDGYDYLFANHFLHHLKDDEISPMLKLMQGLCRYRFLINDLKRSALSYIGYSLGALLLRNSFAFVDGRISICRGFTHDELISFCKEAGLRNAKVGRVNPGRLYIYG